MSSNYNLDKLLTMGKDLNELETIKSNLENELETLKKEKQQVVKDADKYVSSEKEKLKILVDSEKNEVQKIKNKIQKQEKTIEKRLEESKTIENQLQNLKVKTGEVEFNEKAAEDAKKTYLEKEREYKLKLELVDKKEQELQKLIKG